MQLRTTHDGGATWTLDPLPQALLRAADARDTTTISAVSLSPPFALLNVRFANVRDGWIYGTIPSVDRFGGITTSRWLVTLWSTHDGGATWTKCSLPGIGTEGTTFDLQASSREVYLLGEGPKFTSVLVESPVEHNHWTVVTSPPLPFPAGGSETSANIVLNGRTGWLVEGNDRGITGSLRLKHDGHWTEWSPPCSSVGDSYVVPVASNPNDLGVVCEIGGVFSQPAPKAPPGATPGSWWFYTSNNAGLSFHAVRELHAQQGYFATLASPAPNVFFFQYDSGHGLELVVSRNNARSAHAVFRGLIAYLHFMNRSDGVAIATSPSNTPEMIMTHDGGRSWHIQRFVAR
ncbi:MAG: hypothetical protein ACYC0I_06285 [Acidimicrobiales bacterium]